MASTRRFDSTPAARAAAVALGRVGRYRWTICALLFFAPTINYIDRQVLGIPALETTRRGEEQLRASPVDSSAGSCFRTRSVLVYVSKAIAIAKERTGAASGTRVAFRRRPQGWTGVSVDLGAQPRRPTVVQDLSLDPVRGRVYYLVPRPGGAEPQIIQGRIDCDSLWGTSRPRYSKQEPAPIVLRRVR
jgi:hypothetical protein